MANLTERLQKFEIERKEIHEKMKPLKDELKPLSVRLVQVSKNIGYLKCIINKEKV